MPPDFILDRLLRLERHGTQGLRVAWRRRDVAVAPGDEMHVDMKDFLSGGRSYIHAGIEAADCFIGGKDFGSAFQKQRVDRLPLGGIEIEIIRNVPLWNEEAMQPRHREYVTDRDSELIFHDRLIERKVTEGTVFMHEPIGGKAMRQVKLSGRS